MLLLAEVAHQMTSLAIVLCQDVEQERLHVIVERLVIQEQFDQKTEVLTVDLVGVTIHLKHGHSILPVDLHTWRMSPGTFGEMTLQDGPRLHVLQTKLAQEQLWKTSILLRIRTGIPCGDVKFAKLDHLGSPNVNTCTSWTCS